MNNVSGLAVVNDGVINNSYIKGSVLLKTSLNCDMFGCTISGGITGSGFVTQNNGLISNSFFDGNIYGGQYVAGFNVNNLGQITNSYFKGNIFATNNLSGFVINNGDNVTPGTIDQSYFSGTLNISVIDEIGFASGFVNMGKGLIRNSYSVGSFINDYSVGNNSGFLNQGYVPGIDGNIVNCYSSINNIDYGFSNGIFTGVYNSYYNSDVSSSGGSGTGITTSQMKLQSTFSGWNFTDIWNIQENTTYLILKTMSQIHFLDNIFLFQILF